MEVAGARYRTREDAAGREMERGGREHVKAAGIDRERGGARNTRRKRGAGGRKTVTTDAGRKGAGPKRKANARGRARSAEEDPDPGAGEQNPRKEDRRKAAEEE